MGELSNNETELIDRPETNNEPDKISTDVPDIYADDVVKQGNNEFPVFSCSKEEFFNNMTDNRKKLRFKSGSTIQSYMQKTKYKKPFYISYTDDNNKTYKRRIK